ADEWRQFRLLFQRDDDFHKGSIAPDQRDNWLVGKAWFRRAEELVDTLGVSMQGKGPLMYR
ncbi:MAG: hypothetical protein GTO62_20060, partial [Planctomycetales bacterium]|nr:hypothetical protein [Planctomycetales bacterium]